MMISKTDSKFITISNRGRYLTSRGYVFGPIRQPYREKINVIGSMIGAGASILEHLDDGATVELTLINYDKDNSVKQETSNHPVKVTIPTTAVEPAAKKSKAEKTKPEHVEEVKVKEAPKQTTEEPQVEATPVVVEESTTEEVMPAPTEEQPAEEPQVEEEKVDEDMKDNTDVTETPVVEEEPVETKAVQNFVAPNSSKSNRKNKK